MKTVTIGGGEIPIEWNQGVARRFAFRLSKHKIKFEKGAFGDPQRAHSAYLEFLFLVLPPAVYERYSSAEDFATSEEWTEAQAVQIGEAVAACMQEMDADAEKKRSLQSTPLPESS